MKYRYLVNAFMNLAKKYGEGCDHWFDFDKYTSLTEQGNNQEDEYYKSCFDVMFVLKIDEGKYHVDAKCVSNNCNSTNTCNNRFEKTLTQIRKNLALTNNALTADLFKYEN